MSTKYGGNFTNFQNLSVKGSGTASPQNTGMIEMHQGLTQVASTASVSMIGSGTVGSVNSANEHPYFHVSNAGLSAGTGFIRLTNVGASPYTTIRARTGTYLDTDVALSFPAKSGLIGVSGTFTVNLPAISALSYTETAVVITGVRAEDGLVCSLMSGAYETAVSTNRGMIMLGSARPSNTGIDMVFLNFTDTATVVQSPIVGYTTFR